jgi:hypothetical protein
MGISPSIAASPVAASPMKKKMSLSQYTSRKAKRNEALAAARTAASNSTGADDTLNATPASNLATACEPTSTASDLKTESSSLEHKGTAAMTEPGSKPGEGL